MKGFNVLNILLFIISLFLALLYFKEKSSFPVAHYICPKGDECFISEMYKSKDDCETSSSKERGDWLCNSTDLLNIKCHVDPSRMIDSYCK